MLNFRVLWSNIVCLLLEPYMNRYLLDHPNLCEDRRIFDLGSGCGASAIACALGGAAQVTANDTCPVASTAIEMNAAANDVRVIIDSKDHIGEHFNLSEVDVLLIGDMFYESDFTVKIAAWILDAHRKGVKVYIGDPGRLCFTNSDLKKCLVELARYDLPANSWMKNNGFTKGSVWTISKRKTVTS